MLISRPRMPFPYPAFILKTAGIYQTVQTRDMAGGLSLYDITANIFDVQHKTKRYRAVCAQVRTRYKLTDCSMISNKLLSFPERLPGLNSFSP